MSTTSSMYLGAPTEKKEETTKDILAKLYKREPVRAPSVLQRIFHRVNQSDSIYYPCKGKSVNPAEARDVLQESTPFQYPRDEEQFSFKFVQKAWRKKLRKHEVNAKYCCKTNVRSRQQIDLLQRLYIEDTVATDGNKTLLDIDPEFYTVVEGRPTTKRFVMSDYMNNIRDVFRTELMAGFRNDETLLIRQKLKREEIALSDVRKKYLMYLNCFETFLNDDYEDSIHLLRLADQMGIETLAKNDKIRLLNIENSALEFEVHKLEENWRDLKMYQKFLYFVSPVTWRKKYDYIHRRELTEDLKDEISAIFKKYNLGSQGQIPSLANLVDEYMEAVKHEEEPVIFFTKTEELMKVFRFIEIQNLNCLLHAEEIAVPMENMRLVMEEAARKFEREAKIIQVLIDSLYKDIEWEENCASSLKQNAMQHIDGTFRKLVSDDEVLKLHVYVEDVYEGCIGKNDSGLNILDMIVFIEKAYNELVLELDALPQSIVRKSEKYRFAEQNKLSKLCEDTAQKIALVDSITWRLKKSLEPPFVRKARELRFRSAPPEKIEIPPPPPRELTLKEYEFLTYYTDFCKHIDNVAEYGIDLEVEETNFDDTSIMQVHDTEY